MKKILLLITFSIIGNAESGKYLAEKKIIIRMEKRHPKIIKISEEIDKKVSKFNHIYNESKTLFKNARCIEHEMAIDFLRSELSSLKKDKKINIKLYQNMIIDATKDKNKCGDKK